MKMLLSWWAQVCWCWGCRGAGLNTRENLVSFCAKETRITTKPSRMTLWGLFPHIPGHCLKGTGPALVGNLSVGKVGGCGWGFGEGGCTQGACYRCFSIVFCGLKEMDGKAELLPQQLQIKIDWDVTKHKGKVFYGQEKTIRAHLYLKSERGKPTRPCW